MDTNTPSNAVDKAADTANSAIGATKSAANAALDTAASKVEALRSTLSPTIGDAMDSLVSYTKDKPINALLGAMAAGAFLSILFRAGRR